MDNSNDPVDSIPEPPQLLKDWIKENGGSQTIKQVGTAPHGRQSKPFILVTCPLKKLKFEDNTFNPRTPNQAKVDELAASISSLTLVTPLTCAYVDPEGYETRKGKVVERVVLLDGRHRFNALKQLEKDDQEWAKNATVDLKIYYKIAVSDIYMLAVYLNKARKSLAKGEYYKTIVDIYNTKHDELVHKNKSEPTEQDVFKEITARELTNKNFDLSVGRIVGLTAFDEEEGKSWYPMVGLKQQDKIKDSEETGYYCPITAGNMATFLGHLCSNTPYGDDGEKRAIEIGNVLELGVLFRNIILKPVRSYDEATGTTVACKHWPLEALGKLIEGYWSKSFVKEYVKDASLLVHTDLKWDRIKELLQTYYTFMEEQADLVNKYRKEGNLEILKSAWSYQTQADQIIKELKPKMENKLEWLGE